MFKTPIVLFVFNRPGCTQQIFSAISDLQPETLFIVADGPRENNITDEALCVETRNIFNQINWPCNVLKFYADKNIGCRNSIPNGLNFVFEHVDECIILEDDCLPQPTFFQFCEELLEKYRNEPQVMTIGGHRSDGPNEFNSESYFFSKYPSIWGWATWKDRWEKYDLNMTEWSDLRNSSWLNKIFDSDNEIKYWHRMFDKMQNELDTWDYALVFSCWLNKCISIRPKVNMIENIGFDNDATHTKSIQQAPPFASPSNINFPLVHPKHIRVDEIAEKRIEWVSFSGMDKRILQEVWSKTLRRKENDHPKILHLATYYELGGAGRAVQRIYQSLKKQPLRCELMTLHKTVNDRSIRTPKDIDAKIKLKLVHELLSSYRNQRNASNNILESYGEASAGIVEEINTDDAKVVHLHWICNMLSIEDISHINKKIVWTLHDMWPFSGSEHFSHDPGAYFFSHSNSAPLNDVSHKTWIKKVNLWKDKIFTIVAPSRWLASLAIKSTLFGNSAIYVIPHPIDIHFWQPQSQLNAKVEFNLNTNKKQILFIAQDPFNDANKGWDLLQSSLMSIQHDHNVDFELVIVGYEGAIDVKLPFKVYLLGHIKNDQKLALLYSAVDILVVPSRSEAFSQVTLEAQSCGLPVVGFDVGGIPDIIIHQKTGWISKAHDTIDFASGIKWILEDDHRCSLLSENARKNVVTHFSPEIIGQQYFNLYNNILSKEKSPS
jgi:glycosyltransferase involved in cell wall biosynthesis